MYLGSLQVRHRTSTRVIPPRSPPPFSEKWVLWYPAENYGCRARDSGQCFEIRPGKRRPTGHSFVVSATGKKKPGNSSSSSGGDSGKQSPEGDGHNKHKPQGSKKSSNNAGQKPHHVTLDWREFRATLFAREQAEITIQGCSSQAGPNHLGVKWAHPISLPETGSVLVATEKLDGDKNFERKVLLLLKSGLQEAYEGPLGIVINRRLNKKIKHMRSQSPGISTTLGDCSLHIGGPLEGSMFLVRTGSRNLKIPGFEEVIPGLCYSSRNSLDGALALVKKGVLKPHDFRVFLGYAGWGIDQLREEIEANYWHVAACSANLIIGATEDSSESLWSDILQLMGGEYSELSRKPKQDM